MRRPPAAHLTVAAAILAMAAFLAAAGDGAGAAAGPMYRESPPPGHTGGFGEPLCNECHFGAPLNASGGMLRVDAPAVVGGDASYEIHVALTHPELAAAGFQLTVRFAHGDGAGRQAGTLEALDPRTAVAVDTATGVQYAHQTAAGSSLTGDREAHWTVGWTAPRRPADVMVHVAANAANDDASELGDFIYADSTRIPALDQPSGWIGAPGPGSRYRRFR